MSKQSDREDFIAKMSAEGMAMPMIRSLMRAGTTLQRMAEAECSDSTPYDDPKGIRHFADPFKGLVIDLPDPVVINFACGEASHDSAGKPWPKCRWTTSQSRVTCWACKSTLVERRVSRLLDGSPFTPVFSGDPRGAVLKIRVPSGRTDDGAREGICVP